MPSIQATRFAAIEDPSRASPEQLSRHERWFAISVKSETSAREFPANAEEILRVVGKFP
jgi:hypothetical protein